MSRYGLGISHARVLPSIGGNDNYTRLLLRMDGPARSGRFHDRSMRTKVVRGYGNSKILPAPAKMGQALYTDGSGDYLYCLNADLIFGQNDFTVDFWTHINTDPYQYMPLVECWDNTSNNGSWRLFYISGQWRFETYIGGSSALNVGQLPLREWVHIAIVREGNESRFYVNGVMTHTGSLLGVSMTSNYPLLVGGGYVTSMHSANALFDEVKVDIGIARWKANFTPPKQPYDEVLYSDDVVPVMTSSTAPSGSVVSTETYQGQDNFAGWNAFGTGAQPYLANGQTGSIDVTLATARTVKAYTLMNISGTLASPAQRAPRDWTFQAWDGSAWVTLDTQVNQNFWIDGVRRTYLILNNTAYLRYRIVVTANNGHANLGISEMQMFDSTRGSSSATVAGYTQSSLSSPAGEATIAKMADKSAATYAATQAVTGSFVQMNLSRLGYVKNVILRACGAGTGFTAANLNGAQLQKTVDGFNWQTIDTLSDFTDGNTQGFYIESPALAFRVIRNSGSTAVAIADFYLQSVPRHFTANLVPVMTAANAPSGLVVDSGSSSTTFPGWRAFDSDPNSGWVSNQNGGQLEYQFANPVCIKQYTITCTSAVVSTFKDRGPSRFTFEAWNGTAWVILDTVKGLVGLDWLDGSRLVFNAFENDELYSRYRLNVAAPVSSPLAIAEFEMMGEGTAPRPFIASFSQSGTYSSPLTDATPFKMIDGLGNTYAATNLATTTWIQATLNTTATVRAIILRAVDGTDSWGASYVNGAVLQVSQDGSTWTDIATLAGFTNGSAQVFPTNMQIRHIRVYRTGSAQNYVALSEFGII